MQYLRAQVLYYLLAYPPMSSELHHLTGESSETGCSTTPREIIDFIDIQMCMPRRSVLAADEAVLLRELCGDAADFAQASCYVFRANGSDGLFAGCATDSLSRIHQVA